MTGYQTGTDNRLTSDSTYTYEYDKEGNRTTRTNTTTYAVTEYTWDYHNRLTQVTEKDMMGTTTKVVEYTYDVLDRRIAKEVDTTSPFDMADAAIERYVYDDIHIHLDQPSATRQGPVDSVRLVGIHRGIRRQGARQNPVTLHLTNVCAARLKSGHIKTLDSLKVLPASLDHGKQALIIRVIHIRKNRVRLIRLPA